MEHQQEHPLRTFEDLEAWQACRDLRRWVSMVVRDLPAEEKWRLVDQLIRASRSSTANIAEGYGLFHYSETIQFCRRARGSAYEVLDHLLTARDEGFIDQGQVAEGRNLIEKCVKLINGYVRYLEAQRRES